MITYYFFNLKGSAHKSNYIRPNFLRALECIISLLLRMIPIHFSCWRSTYIAIIVLLVASLKSSANGIPVLLLRLASHDIFRLSGPLVLLIFTWSYAGVDHVFLNFILYGPKMLLAFDNFKYLWTLLHLPQDFYICYFCPQDISIIHRNNHITKASSFFTASFVRVEVSNL